MTVLCSLQYFARRLPLFLEPELTRMHSNGLSSPRHPYVDHCSGPDAVGAQSSFGRDIFSRCGLLYLQRLPFLAWES